MAKVLFGIKKYNEEYLIKSLTGIREGIDPFSKISYFSLVVSGLEGIPEGIIRNFDKELQQEIFNDPLFLEKETYIKLLLDEFGEYKS